MRVLGAEQSRIFLATALKTHYGPIFALALTTGMRPSEYLGLKWPDIDWERGTVGVVRTLEKVKGSWRFADTKRGVAFFHAHATSVVHHFDNCSGGETFARTEPSQMRVCGDEQHRGGAQASMSTREGPWRRMQQIA